MSVFCSILLIGFAYSGISFAEMQAHALNYLWLGGWIITLSIAASFRHPSLGLTRLFNGGLVGNKMARRLFAMMAISILLFGLVKVKYLGFSIWQYDTGISLFVFCILIVALLIIWHTANWLNKIDLRRIKAENELKVLNGELGIRVEERTAELSDLLKKYKESELKFRTLAEKSIVGIYRIQNGRLTYINFRFAEIFGYRPEELMDTLAMETILPESYRSIALGDAKAHIAGADDSVHHKAAARKKNGETIWVEFYSNTAVIGGEPTIIGSMIDITERKMAEDGVQKSKANLRAILETSNTGYALLGKELNIVTFNQRALQFVNLHFGAFPNPGDSPFDFLPKDRIPVFSSYANRVLQGENISNEVNYPQPDGTSLFYNVSMSPIKDNHDEIVGLMLAITDITDIKKYTNAIEEQNKNLLEIAWLQSHVVRGPLARMMGIINLLREHDLDNTEYDEYLTHLSTSADELDTIIKNITNKTEEIK
nr:PAS domain S-box protein [uncultured Mucilaginibacter sp.]